MKKPTLKQIGRYLHLAVPYMALIIGIVALVVSTNDISLLKENDQATQNTIETIQNDQRIADFCFQEQIRPCDEPGIEKWNANHRDNPFSL
jgi:hypothetical protein